MTGPRRLTIDLDGSWCYRAIHGAIHGAIHASDVACNSGDDGDGDPDALLLAGLPRFLAMCERLGARATLFVVGRDLRGARYARLIHAAAAAGHDVQSHSFSHAYDLSRWPRLRIADDLRAANDAIAAVTGVRPEGFRAPGYNLSATLLDAAHDAGLMWSSSLLPSPAYWAARAAVIGKTRLQTGRPSASLVGPLRDWTPGAGRRRRHDNGLREFPMSAPWGIPFTGTTLALLPDALAARLADAAVGAGAGDDGDVMLELHAADFVDGDLLPPGQPDRGVPLSDKLRRIERAARRIVSPAQQPGGAEQR